MCVCMYVYIYIYTPISLSMYVYIYIYIHTYCLDPRGPLLMPPERRPRLVQRPLEELHVGLPDLLQDHAALGAVLGDLRRCLISYYTISYHIMLCMCDNRCCNIIWYNLTYYSITWLTISCSPMERIGTSSSTARDSSSSSSTSPDRLICCDRCA